MRNVKPKPTKIVSARETKIRVWDIATQECVKEYFYDDVGVVGFLFVDTPLLLTNIKHFTFWMCWVKCTNPSKKSCYPHDIYTTC
jgi:hypothetical protein